MPSVTFCKRIEIAGLCMDNSLLCLFFSLIFVSSIMEIQLNKQTNKQTNNEKLKALKIEIVESFYTISYKPGFVI